MTDERVRKDFVWIMGKFNNGTASEKDAELLWSILMENWV